MNHNHCNFSKKYNNKISLLFIRNLSFNMKIYSLSIYSRDSNDEIIRLAAEYDLSSFGFFQRSTVQDIIMVISKAIAERTSPGQRQRVEEQRMHFFGGRRNFTIFLILIGSNYFYSLCRLCLRPFRHSSYRSHYHG